MKKSYLALLLSFSLSACTLPQHNTIVVDGDTIYIGDTKYRLWGIDAPELNEPLGHEAKTVLRNIVFGARVTCESKGRSHDRVVAKCYVGNTDLGMYMVKQGMALDCFRYSNGYYKRYEQPGAHSRITQKSYCHGR